MVKNPTLQSEADIGREVYLKDIFGAHDNKAVAEDGRVTMLGKGNYKWVDEGKDYYDQSKRDESFKDSPRGKIHEWFHLRMGSSHTARWEQFNLMAEDLFAEAASRGSKSVNLTDVKNFSCYHKGMVDAYIQPEYRQEFRDMFSINEKEPLNSKGNPVMSEILFKASYIIADTKEKHGITTENFDLNKSMNLPLHSIKPEEFMFKVGVLDFDANGAHAKQSIIALPDTNIKAVSFAIEAVNKFAQDIPVRF